jgi:hypothetical protein
MILSTPLGTISEGPDSYIEHSSGVVRITGTAMIIAAYAASLLVLGAPVGNRREPKLTTLGWFAGLVILVSPDPRRRSPPQQLP